MNPREIPMCYVLIRIRVQLIIAASITEIFKSVAHNAG